MSPKSKRKGLAGLYSDAELKQFVSGYLILLAVAEGLIFFFCWVQYLAGDQAAFPWKAYLLTALCGPVAIGFLLGVTVYAINHFAFQDEPAPAEDDTPIGGRIDRLVRSFRRLPLLFSMLLLLVAGGLVFKLDDLLAALARAGERASYYLLIVLATVLGVATLLALVWMILSYKLRRQRMRDLQQYRLAVTEKIGMVILEDETVLDREGRVVSPAPENRGSLIWEGEQLGMLPRRSAQAEKVSAGQDDTGEGESA